MRLRDNRALFEATRWAGEVLLLYVWDKSDSLTISTRRQDFLRDCLDDLNRVLRARGSAILVREGESQAAVSEAAREWGASAVFTASDYEPDAKILFEKTAASLQQLGIAFHTVKDHAVFDGREILTQQEAPFKVFSAYKNAWLSRMTLQDIQDFNADFSKLSKRAVNFHAPPRHPDFPGGESAARNRLKKFEKRIDDYDNQRDFPAIQGTSHLSADLRFGTLSVREVVRSSLKRRSKGSQAWLSELIWRDFFHMILDRFPRVASSAYHAQYDGIRWPGTESDFRAWCEGRTGFPLVDAAMRQLNRTGWMHNRLRMVTASFLVKDLLVDWRRGEEYFASRLIDYDLAANNGNWQWCASTGCDAQPYFRIFNPVSQSEKFDENGDFIRTHCPELAGFAKKRIHWPNDADMVEQLEAGCKLGKDYPKPIVFHNLQRYKALSLFEDRRESAKEAPR